MPDSNTPLTFYIELSHTPEECMQALKQVEATGYLTHFEWGCKDGRHVGFYRMVTDNEDDPQRILPSYVKKNAVITRVRAFRPADLKGEH